MVTQTVETPFKDYCLILQVHPEADADMVEAAYWHLARRYSEEAAYDSNATTKLDDLNEAYSVMGAPGKRPGYLTQRDAVLGEGALPVAPLPTREPPPLAVMEKQRPKPVVQTRPRVNIDFDFGFEAVTSATWQHAFVVLVFVSAAVYTLAASVDTIWSLALLAGAVAISAGPVTRELTKLLKLLPRKWRPGT